METNKLHAKVFIGRKIFAQTAHHDLCDWVNRHPEIEIIAINTIVYENGECNTILFFKFKKVKK